MEKFDKTDLLNKVKVVFYNERANRKFITEISKELMNRIPSVKIMDIINENEVYVDDKELYWLSSTLEELQKKFDYDYPIKTLDYFTEMEISEAENVYIKRDNDNLEETVLIIDNVTKIEEDEYVVPDMPYEKIIEAWVKGVTTYKYETQRPGVIVDTGIGLVMQPDINKESVKEIAKAITNGNFYSNMLTWNILHTKKEKFEYKEDTKQLIFYKDKGSDINIIDGFHRTLGIQEALRIRPELANKKMQIKIVNYDIEKALGLISQETKGNKIPEEREVSANLENFTKVVNFLSKDSKSKLLDKISVIEDEVYKYNTKYVLFSTLHDSIEDWFTDLKTIKFQSEFNNISRHIEEVINYIITYYEIDFSDIKESQKNKRPFTENNMFAGYVWLAYKLFDYNNWDEKLHDFLKALDEYGVNFNIKSKQKNKKYRNMVYNYFKDIWDLI